mgnify:CR=1 FL=1
MNRYNVTMLDELGETFTVEIEICDLVENVTEYVREEYFYISIVYIMPIY